MDPHAVGRSGKRANAFAVSTHTSDVDATVLILDFTVHS